MKRSPLFLALLTLVAAVLAGILTRPAPAGAQAPAVDGPVVVRAYYDDIAQVQALAEWTEPWEVNEDGRYVIVDVTPAGYARLIDMGFRVEVDEGLTAALNAANSPLPGQGGGIPGYPCYRTVEETFASAQQMVADFPDLAQWLDIGDSWDKVTPGGPTGYDMMVLVLTNQNTPGPKPKLMAISSIHAREYTPAETTTRFAEHMLANYGLDPDVTWLLDHQEIHLVLQGNPDGRKIAEGGSSWRKNRNDSDGCSTTFGVDLNRNFQFYWNTGGSSGNACDITYRGSAAASEPETQAIQSHAFAIFPDQRDAPITAAAPLTTTGIFLDLHSYAEEILWSWGFTSSPPPNNTGLQTLARKMGYFGGYDATQSLYTTSGSTKDFAYGELGIPAYTIEQGTSFFQSCSYFENTVWPDMLPTLLYAAKASRYSYIIPAGPDATSVAVTPAAVNPGDPVTLTAVLDDTRYNNSQGTEPTQDVVAAEYYLDTPPWMTTTTPISLPMTAVDGAFDEPVEVVEAAVDTSALCDDGRHTLYVRGQDAAGNWGAVSAVWLDVTAVAPTATFSSNSPVAAGATVVFTNTTTGCVDSYLWDFGDGTTSTAVDPTHVYASPGSYTVALTATNSLGSDVYTAVVENLVAPTAAFTSSSPDTLGETTVFTSTAAGTNLSYLWDFGDGATSTAANPTHDYTAVGTYTVALTVSNGLGSDVAADAVVIQSPDYTLYLPAILK